tara:strand:+ start:10 stop:225 length:216 start_codon:yes stop_codon:yes gene_type:complete
MIEIKVEPRTDDVWRTYLDRLTKVSLNNLAKVWGMNSLYGTTTYGGVHTYSKEKTIEILMIHLDVNEKVIK